MLSNILKLLDNEEVGVQETVDTVLGAGLFGLVEAFGLDSAGDAFGPADVGEVVDGCLSCQYMFCMSDSGCCLSGEWNWEGLMRH